METGKKQIRTHTFCRIYIYTASRIIRYLNTPQCAKAGITFPGRPVTLKGEGRICGGLKMSLLNIFDFTDPMAFIIIYIHDGPKAAVETCLVVKASKSSKPLYFRRRMYVRIYVYMYILRAACTSTRNSSELYNLYDCRRTRGRQRRGFEWFEMSALQKRAKEAWDNDDKIASHRRFYRYH